MFKPSVNVDANVDTLRIDPEPISFLTLVLMLILTLTLCVKLKSMYSFQALMNRFLKCVDDWLAEFPIISGTEGNITTNQIFEFFVLNLISSDLQLCTHKLNKT